MAGFRVDKVALAAEVSRGAQTHHFPTKEDLVLGALQKLYQASTEASTTLIDRLGREDDVLEALMQDSAKFYLGPNFIISMSLLNLGEHEPELEKCAQCHANIDCLSRRPGSKRCFAPD
ncbi:TetR/AcrR family transcriptional regulator [Cupriavidus basilensis]